MQIDQSIFKSYDIRGIYPTQINEQNTTTIIEAIYNFFQSSFGKTTPLTVVLGRDMRLSSPSLFAVAKETLISLGANVIAQIHHDSCTASPPTKSKKSASTGAKSGK